MSNEAEYCVQPYLDCVPKKAVWSLTLSAAEAVDGAKSAPSESSEAMNSAKNRRRTSMVEPPWISNSYVSYYLPCELPSDVWVGGAFWGPRSGAASLDVISIRSRN